VEGNWDDYIRNSGDMASLVGIFFSCVVDAFGRKEGRGLISFGIFFFCTHTRMAINDDVAPDDLQCVIRMSSS
jgi:hypothetical protein